MSSTAFEMAFSSQLRLVAVEEANFLCPVCQNTWPPELQKYHSATTAHLVRVETAEGAMFLATDTPLDFHPLEGHLLSLSANPFGPETLTDGVLLCDSCHRSIHKQALNDAKLLIPGFRGHTPPMSFVADITMICLERHLPPDWDV